MADSNVERERTEPPSEAHGFTQEDIAIAKQRLASDEPRSRPRKFWSTCDRWKSDD